MPARAGWPGVTLLESCYELGGRDDGDAPEGTEVLHGLITGHDQVGPPGCRCFQHAVVRFVAQHRHALCRIDGVGGFCHGSDQRGGVVEDDGEFGLGQHAGKLTEQRRITRKIDPTMLGVGA